MKKLYNNIVSKKCTTYRQGYGFIKTPDVIYCHQQTSGFSTTSNEGEVKVIYGKDNLILKEDFVNYLSKYSDYSKLILTHDGFSFSIDKSQKDVESDLLKSFVAMNRDQTVKAIDKLMEKESLLNSFDKASKILKASKFKKLSGNITKVLCFDTFLAAIVLESTTNKNLLNSKAVVEFVRELTKLIRHSYLGKDPLSFEYLKDSSSTIKTDKDCITWILNAERSSLTEPQLLILFKTLSQSLKSSLSGTSSTDSTKITAIGIATKVLNTLKLEIEALPHKTNKSGKPTKSYKNLLSLIEVKQSAIVKIATIFNTIVSSLLSCSQDEVQFMLKALFGSFNFSRLLKSNSDLKSPIFLDEIKGSILGENSRRLSKYQIFELLPELDDTLNELFLGLDSKSLETGYNLSDKPGNFHISNKAGPNGSPALLAINMDAFALLEEPVLLEHISKLYSALGISGFDEMIIALTEGEEQIKKLAKWRDPNNDGTIRKLTASRNVVFHDKGGKDRIIAEVD
jgi:hypothetical protein